MVWMLGSRIFTWLPWLSCLKGVAREAAGQTMVAVEPMVRWDVTGVTRHGGGIRRLHITRARLLVEEGEVISVSSGGG
jgi:hypothetical protein